MDILAVFGVGIVACAFCVLLRQINPNVAMMTSLATGVILFLIVLSQTSPILTMMTDLNEKIGLPIAYSQILLKALGICFITQLASDTCRDCHETAIATNVELAGKTAVLILSIPLFTKLIEIATKLINNSN